MADAAQKDGNGDAYLDMGSVERQVSTKSPAAQKWFNRGWAQVLGFNHEEAIRCFSEALKADDDCLMAHWGLAFAHGPNYNNPDGLDMETAFSEAQKAAKLAEKGNGQTSAVEKALAQALTERYCHPVGSVDAPALNKRFAQAMRSVFEKFADDVDVRSLYAEALMGLAPWKLWTPPFQEEPIKPGIPETEEIVRVLEEGLEKHPGHPGLCHLYIHTMELSPHPEKALAAADQLRTGVPDSGHLLHMPAHIDMWVGQYKEAVDMNAAGIAADDKYVKVTGCAENFYKAYRMHNIHFLVWAAMFDGQFEKALKYCRKINSELQPEHIRFEYGAFPLGKVFFEAFRPTVFHTLIRFGKWEEILKEEVPEDSELYAATIPSAHYARATALGVLGRVEEAREEQKKFEEALKNPALEGRMLHNNKVFDTEGVCGVLNVAQKMLEGELQYRLGNYEKAFAELREAVKRDEALVYDEPWGWMVPARHALGALLLEQGRVEEAEAVYRRDLQQYKDNIWALTGLLRCLKKRGAGEEETQNVQASLKTMSVRADTIIKASCFCAKKACCNNGV